MRKDTSEGFSLQWELGLAYYSLRGELLRAYQKRARKNGAIYWKAVPRNYTKILAWFAEQGKHEVKLIDMGILPRK